MATDPICAPATPALPSALAVVRVSGQDLAERLAPLLRLPPPRMAALRRLAWDAGSDRALVLHFPAPHSYTGEDVVEFHLHGNPLLVERFLQGLGALGIRLAEPGEFTRRALLNGKQSLLEAEALRDLIGASTDAQLRQARAAAGAGTAWLAEARGRIAPWIARAEAAVDYGEEEGIELDTSALRAAIAELGRWFHVEHLRGEAARWLREGISLLLVGRPNSGKSTLFNVLAREDRAIVTPRPGTTRDVLEARSDWAGLPLRVYDTAGFRPGGDEVERLGMERVAPLLDRADLVLHLVPATDPGPTPTLEALLAPVAERVLAVRTFSDRVPPAARLGPGPWVSATAGELVELEQALKSRFLGPLAPEACLGALGTARQRELLRDLVEQCEALLELPEEAPALLYASTLQGLWGLLARLSGEDRADSALDQVFSGFCLGK